MNKRLLGKHCLITGAARGIGAAIAEKFAEEGAKVCLADINVEGCTQLAEKISAKGGEAIAAELDVTIREQMTEVIQYTAEQFGSLNVMINNAGINRPMMFLEVTDENWDQIMKVNGLGTLIGMQEAAKQMIAQGPEQEPYKIINAGSCVSRQAFDDVVPYSCAKHAVLGLINGGAKALADHNITVNGYGPGVVETELWSQLDKDLVEIGKFDKPGQAMPHLAETMILMKRCGKPDDVVGTVMFLASPDSDYMTGQLLMIDGGMILQ